MSVRAEGKPGGPRNAVQFNDAGAFGGDAGLTYDARQLVISGNEDKSTPLLKARAGDFRASVIAQTFVADADVLYTAVAAGPDGNNIAVSYRSLGASQPLTIGVVGSAITINMATDGAGLVVSTGSDVIAAVNADMSASALVGATLAPGNDGSGLEPSFADYQLSGGALAAGVVWIDERGRLNVQLQTGIGLNAINVRDPDGVVVAHLDNDGGFGFANERFQVSQGGNMTVNTEEPLPLVGNVSLQYQINGSTLFSIAAGGGYSFSVFSAAPGDILFNVAAGTGQTGDLFCAFDENFVKTFRVLANGDVRMEPDFYIQLPDDDVPGDFYRLKINSGVLSVELVV